MTYLHDVYKIQLDNVVSNYGKNISIHYWSTSNCSSCSFDPINKEATNSFCSTCNGQFFFHSAHSLMIKGAFYSFVGNMKFSDYALHRYGFSPEHDARITCLLQDVLLDVSSPTGRSYLDADKNEYVEVDRRKYLIDGTYRAGIDSNVAIVATLRETK